MNFCSIKLWFHLPFPDIFKPNHPPGSLCATKSRVKHLQLWATMYCFMVQKYSIAGCVMIVGFQLYVIFVMISSLKGKAMR